MGGKLVGQNEGGGGHGAGGDGGRADAEEPAWDLDCADDALYGGQQDRYGRGAGERAALPRGWVARGVHDRQRRGVLRHRTGRLSHAGGGVRGRVPEGGHAVAGGGDLAEHAGHGGPPADRGGQRGDGRARGASGVHADDAGFVRPVLGGRVGRGVRRLRPDPIQHAAAAARAGRHRVPGAGREASEADRGQVRAGGGATVSWTCVDRRRN